MSARGWVVTVVVVGVLGAGAVIADRTLKEQTEDRLAAEVSAQVPGLTGTSVDIRGVPFLLQVASGALDDVRVAADGGSVDGLEVDDVVLDLAGVSTGEPTTVERVELRAYASLAAVDAVVETPMNLSIEDGFLVGSGEVLGFELAVLMSPRAAGRQVEVDVEAVRIAGLEVDAENLPSAVSDALASLTVSVDSLPDGIELTDVTVDGQGFALVATGQDVVLEAAEP